MRIFVIEVSIDGCKNNSKEGFLHICGSSKKKFWFLLNWGNCKFAKFRPDFTKKTIHLCHWRHTNWHVCTQEYYVSTKLYAMFSLWSFGQIFPISNMKVGPIVDTSTYWIIMRRNDEVLGLPWTYCKKFVTKLIKTINHLEEGTYFVVRKKFLISHCY